MKRLIILVSCFCISFVACEEIETAPSPVPLSLDFSNLQIRQQAAYQRYIATCNSLEDDFEFTGDILIVEVIEENGQLMLQESLTAESPMYNPSQSPISYPITITNNQINIPESARLHSLLFAYYMQDELFLTPAQNMSLEQDGCFLSLDNERFSGFGIGIIDNFEIGNLEQNNQMAVYSNAGILNLDLHAYLIYNQNRILINHAIIDQNKVGGWVLME